MMIYVHWSHLISARSRFFHSFFYTFSQFSQKPPRITKCLIYHMKDLKSGHLFWQRERAWLPLKGGHAPENEPRTFSTKIELPKFWVELLSILNNESITLFYGFLKRYITFLQPQGLKSYEASKFEVSKCCPIYLIKRTFFSVLEL